MEFLYKKSLGQNFIYDTNFLQTIVAKLAVQNTDTIVEVGAGAGTLTQVLAATGCQVYSVEIDQRLQPVLQNRFGNVPNVHLIWGDALQQDFSHLANFRLIANVPYYITTPLLMQFLSLPNCSELNVLVADEVAERIVAPVGSRNYGALSVTCQLAAKVTILKKVPRTMFTPQPNVDSALIRLVKNQQPWQPQFGQFLKIIFASRRKTILNALSRALNLDKEKVLTILQAVNLAATLRPEQIAPTKYAEIFAISRKYAH